MPDIFLVGFQISERNKQKHFVDIIYIFPKGRKSSNFVTILMKRTRLLNLKKRHVSATPLPSSVYGWNNNDEQYIAEF